MKGGIANAAGVFTLDGVYRVKGALIKKNKQRKTKMPPTHLDRWREGEKKRGKYKRKPNLRSNLLRRFASSDFEIRLDVTQANEKK